MSRTNVAWVDGRWVCVVGRRAAAFEPSAGVVGGIESYLVDGVSGKVMTGRGDGDRNGYGDGDGLERRFAARRGRVGKGAYLKS